jgi:hypothetical protein
MKGYEIACNEKPVFASISVYDISGSSYNS